MLMPETIVTVALAVLVVSAWAVAVIVAVGVTVVVAFVVLCEAQLADLLSSATARVSR